MTAIEALLAALSGGVVGIVLGLVGGGGSILAVPLLVYLVGVTNPHVAIGTSALSVAASAASALIGHARAGTVAAAILAATLSCFAFSPGSMPLATSRRAASPLVRASASVKSGHTPKANFLCLALKR